MLSVWPYIHTSTINSKQNRHFPSSTFGIFVKTEKIVIKKVSINSKEQTYTNYILSP